MQGQKHGWHENEKYSVKEITISCAVYHEKLHANGDISSLIESVTIFLLCTSNLVSYTFTIITSFPSASPVADWKAEFE